MLRMWVLTVLTETSSDRAISGRVRFVGRNRSTRNSLGLSSSGGDRRVSSMCGAGAPCRKWGEAMDLEVIRPGKSADDEIHERAGLGNALRHAVIEVCVGVEQPHPARLRIIGVDGAVSPQRLKTGRHR